jgi:hypothetical protein
VTFFLIYLTEIFKEDNFIVHAWGPIVSRAESSQMLSLYDGEMILGKLLNKENATIMRADTRATSHVTSHYC